MSMLITKETNLQRLNSVFFTELHRDQLIHLFDIGFERWWWGICNALVLYFLKETSSVLNSLANSCAAIIINCNN